MEEQMSREIAGWVLGFLYKAVRPANECLYIIGFSQESHAQGSLAMMTTMNAQRLYSRSFGVPLTPAYLLKPLRLIQPPEQLRLSQLVRGRLPLRLASFSSHLAPARPPPLAS